MPAKFVLRKGKTGQFSFSLLAANGQPLATSETYATKRAAINGIRSVQKNGGTAIVDDQTVTASAPAKTVVRTPSTARGGTAARGTTRPAPARATGTARSANGTRASRIPTSTARSAARSGTAPTATTAAKKPRKSTPAA